MGFRKSTLRRMPPMTRKLAHLIDDMSSVKRRAVNLLQEFALIEGDSRHLARQAIIGLCPTCGSAPTAADGMSNDHEAEWIDAFGADELAEAIEDLKS